MAAGSTYSATSDRFAAFQMGAGVSDAVKRHAYYGGQDHRDGAQTKQCSGVGDIVHRLVNDLILPGQALTRDRQTLSQLIGDDDTQEKVHHFTELAKAQGSADWTLTQDTFTLSVRITEATKALFQVQAAAADPIATISLKGDGANQRLTLTINTSARNLHNPDYRPDTTILQSNAPAGDYCLAALHQVDHAQHSQAPSPRTTDSDDDSEDWSATLSDDTDHRAYAAPPPTAARGSSETAHLRQENRHLQRRLGQYIRSMDHLTAAMQAAQERARQRRKRTAQSLLQADAVLSPRGTG